MRVLFVSQSVLWEGEQKGERGRKGDREREMIMVLQPLSVSVGQFWVYI